MEGYLDKSDICRISEIIEGTGITINDLLGKDWKLPEFSDEETPFLVDINEEIARTITDIIEVDAEDGGCYVYDRYIYYLLGGSKVCLTLSEEQCSEVIRLMMNDVIRRKIKTYREAKALLLFLTPWEASEVCRVLL